MTADRPHGPLPVLLVCLTVVTGLVDAFSYLSLGHVFVANMTGNVVFLGFALAGVGEISIMASLLAVLAFVVGATMGGRLAAGRALHRGHLLAAATAVQAGIVLGASVSATDADWFARAGYGRPKRRCTPLGRTRSHHYGAHLDRYRTGRRHHTAISARSETDLGPRHARGCVHRRSVVALGRCCRTDVVSGSTAGRLRCERLRGGWPPTIRSVAVAH